MLPRAGQEELKSPLIPTMSTVNVERVRPAISPEKKLGTTILAGRNGLVNRYFYFAMSLLLAAIVVEGSSVPSTTTCFILRCRGPSFSRFMTRLSPRGLVSPRWSVYTKSVGITAIIMARFDTVQLHQSGADAFLSIPFYDMIAFGVCIALAIHWRAKPEVHRRLIFIATCGLMDAAFGRFDYLFNHNLFFPCLDLLIILGVARDLLVDRRVHKVYLYAAPLLIVGQSLSVYMWRSNPAWWQGITRAILG